MSKMIKQAKQRVVYLAPGISCDVAEAIIRCTHKTSKVRMEIILDPNPEICRHGYGVLEAVNRLFDFGIEIRKSAGIRIGVLIVDEKAWIYSPTPLMIEDDPDETIVNAVEVNIRQAEDLMYSLIPNLSDYQDKPQKYTAQLVEPLIIGKEPFKSEDLEIAKNDLELRPPKQFNLERTVMVYSSFIQFVELSLTGLSLNRSTIKIPQKLLNVTKNNQIEERLKASYRLIDEESEISKDIQSKVSELRKTYLRSMGKRLGNVILLSKKPEFLKEIAVIEKEIEKYLKEVEAKLKEEIEKSQKELVSLLLPNLVENPPKDLVSGISTEVPDKETLINYINDEIKKGIPDVKKLIKDMKLNCDFKDVTYEMLEDDKFQGNLKIQYPYVNWPKPYEKYEAAKVIEKMKETEQLIFDFN
jgi:hypothetical protein